MTMTHPDQTAPDLAARQNQIWAEDLARASVSATPVAPPASDAPAPPRETASSLASRVEEWVARQCTANTGCTMDHKFWDYVVARLHAVDHEAIANGSNP